MLVKSLFLNMGLSKMLVYSQLVPYEPILMRTIYVYGVFPMVFLRLTQQFQQLRISSVCPMFHWLNPDVGYFDSNFPIDSQSMVVWSMFFSIQLGMSTDPK